MKIENFIVVLIAVVLTGCIPDEVCRQDSDIVAGISCEWTTINDEGELVLQERWDSVTMKGVEKDSILYWNEKNIEIIYAPFRQDTTITGLYIKWHNIEDTLWIKHTNEQNFISMACGCFIYHTIDSVWSGKHFIDTAYVVNTSVVNIKEENIVVVLK